MGSHIIRDLGIISPGITSSGETRRRVAGRGRDGGVEMVIACQDKEQTCHDDKVGATVVSEMTKIRYGQKSRGALRVG